MKKRIRNLISEQQKEERKNVEIKVAAGSKKPDADEDSEDEDSSDEEEEDSSDEESDEVYNYTYLY